MPFLYTSLLTNYMILIIIINYSLQKVYKVIQKNRTLLKSSNTFIIERLRNRYAKK